ncbi:MAG: hypothetical protein C0519_09715 [Hyphomicrobium sp.]|nr:hypothetical protein [Hyphomicrobium sp.]
MTTSHSLHIHLPPEAVSYIEKKIADGSFSNANDAIEDGIRVLLDHDTSLDHWLRDTVIPSFEEYHVDPDSAVRGEDILARIHHRAGDTPMTNADPSQT